MMNRTPVSNRKKVQFLVALTILAWATQTLMRQLARGEDTPATDAPAADQFVPGGARVMAGATLEVRAEATIHSPEVKLRQVCRWANADRQYFAAMADLTIAHFRGDAPFQAVSIDEIRMTLHDAGANLGMIRFAGATACTVARSDVKYNDATALQQWSDAKEGKVKAVGPLEGSAAGAGAVAARARVGIAKPQAADPAVRTLRDLIIADAVVRLNVPADELQMTFNPADEKTLNLAEPQFKFNLEPRRVFGLGEVSWNVLVVMEGGQQKQTITATARAWLKEVELVRPVTYRQVIQTDDLIEKRILTDKLPDDVLLALAQCVGQEAARELKPGMVMTARMVNAVDLVRPGQFVTVTLSSGGVRIKTVARAKESGSYGQTVKVQNDATREMYEVVLTGPQAGTISPTGVGK